MWRGLLTVPQRAGAFGFAVAEEDGSGNIVTTFNRTLTVALGSNPSHSTLSGPLTVVANQSVAAFSGLGLNNLGNGYTLQVFTAGDNTAVTTSPFNVVDRLVITKIPSPLGGTTSVAAVNGVVVFTNVMLTGSAAGGRWFHVSFALACRASGSREAPLAPANSAHLS
jgi:hypothetical protein